MTYYSNITGKTYDTEKGRRVAEYRLGKKQNKMKPETLARREAIKANNDGRLFSDESRANMSEGQKRAWANPEYRAKKSASLAVAIRKKFLGVPKPKEQREKMRKAKLGVPKSVEHVASMRTSQSRRWAAVRGEYWAVEWYLDHGKEVPEHRPTAESEIVAHDRAARDVAIRRYYAEKGQ